MTRLEIEQAVESIWALFRETDQRLDRRFEATEREIAALSAQTRAAENLFIGKWGRLLEALVRTGAAELFRARGITVNRTLERVRARRGGEEMELDLLLVNGEALVVVEVKSTLRVEDVRALVEDLKTFAKFFPEYRDYRCCHVPRDYIPKRSYPLLQAREVLRLLAEEGIEGSGKEAEPRGDGV